MISVCMPYWNRQRALDEMFINLAAMYPGLEREISVCDDGTQPPAVVPRGTILSRLPRKDRPLNPCVPINVAVNASKGDIIVLTNPEILHKEQTLLRMQSMMLTENDYVSATCWDAQRGWLAGSQVNYETQGRLPVPPGASFHFCVMFSRALWERAGGFDEDYRNGLACDDNDWVWRAAVAGARFRTTKSTVEHLHQSASIKWLIPHNRELFYQKWPEARRNEVIRDMINRV